MISKDLVAASAKPLVLSILSESDSYGYAIIRRVREISNEQIKWTDGMLYPVLHRLERDGLITSQWKKSETGRERKYYSLKRQGRQMLETEKQQWFTVHNTLCQLWNPKPLSS